MRHPCFWVHPFQSSSVLLLNKFLYAAGDRTCQRVGPHIQLSGTGSSRVFMLRTQAAMPVVAHKTLQRFEQSWVARHYARGLIHRPALWPSLARHALVNNPGVHTLALHHLAPWWFVIQP